MSGDEELKTPEEKEAWLRAHGVEIETPEDRRQKAANAAAALSTDGPTRRVKYVKIPADDSKPFEQLECILASDAAGDCLPDVVESQFAGGGSIDENKMREQAVRQIGERGAGLSASALEHVAAGGKTETFALVRPSATNGHKGVYLYLDEVGMLKNLPPNPRAVAIATVCGFDNVRFFGDMYCGAVVADHPQPMMNVDFTVAELDSSSPWLKHAGNENAAYQQSMRQVQDAMREKGGMQTISMTGDDGFKEHEEEGYRWSQTDDEVEVAVAVTPGTKAKDIKVHFKAQSITVSIAGQVVLDLASLYAPTRPDECLWTMGGDEVICTLAKVDESSWLQLQRL